MTGSKRTNWRNVMAEVERRIYTREWQPGQSIPNEADLAIELGCARVTVNRALRTLAEIGLLDRRRKAGTRVALHPVSKATLSIPLIRNEIEASGKSYGYHLLSQKAEPARLLNRIFSQFFHIKIYRKSCTIRHFQPARTDIKAGLRNRIFHL